MRILHTADWHIGQTLRGHGRDHEHRAALASLVAVAEAREADALIVAGDVFDHQNPSGEAMRLFYDTIVALRRARPSMTMVVVAGNHDAPGRLEAPEPLFAAMDVTVVGSVRRREGRIVAGRRHLVVLRDRRGDVAAEVLAVSHPTAACLPPFSALETSDGQSAIVAATRDLYAELMETSGAGRVGLPLVVTGHLHVAGAEETPEGAERRIPVGGEHAVPAGVFPTAATYVALGHLHRSQAVGAPHVRYSGSLLPLSATEVGYRHGVTLVTLGVGPPAIEHIELPRPVPFLRVPATGDCRLDELDGRLAALGLDPALPIQQRPFVQIWLTPASRGADHASEAERIAEAYPVRVVSIKAERHATAATERAVVPTERLADLAPDVVFTRAFERAHGRPPDAVHMAAFHEAAATAGTET
jgi:exonuclease SbcD